MAVTPLKMVKTTWLSQSGKFFGWFWGGLFSSLFWFGAVFFQKMAFLDFQNFKNYPLSIFRGPRGDLWRYFSIFVCFYHKPYNIWGIYRYYTVTLLNIYYILYAVESYGWWFCPPPSKDRVKKIGSLILSDFFYILVSIIPYIIQFK